MVRIFCSNSFWIFLRPSNQGLDLIPCYPNIAWIHLGVSAGISKVTKVWWFLSWKVLFPPKNGGGALLHFTTIVSWTNEDLENFGTWTSEPPIFWKPPQKSLFSLRFVRWMVTGQALGTRSLRIIVTGTPWRITGEHWFPLLKGMISWPKKWEACSQPLPSGKLT